MIREAPARRTALGAGRSVVESSAAESMAVVEPSVTGCGEAVVESSGAESGMKVVESDGAARGLRTLSERTPA